MPTKNQTADVHNHKVRLRHEMRAARSAMSLEQRAAASSAISSQVIGILSSIQFNSMSPVGVYLAKSDEVNIDAVAEALLARDVQVVAPVTGERQAAPFYALRDLTSLKVGPFGVREPHELAG